MATINSPTLASDWTPANPSACPDQTNYWQWDYGRGIGSAPNYTVLGGPSQTTNGCLPTGWDGQMTYLGAQCPSSYTAACGGTHNSPYTCCPTAYSFSCFPLTEFPNEMEPTFRCMSQYTSSSTAVITYWDVQANTTEQNTRPQTSPSHLFALGIIYATPAPAASTKSPTSSVNSSPTPSDSLEKGSDGLTVGASAGVGVGVAGGILLIAVLVGWLIYRRKSFRHHPRRPSSKEVALHTWHGGRDASTGHNGGGVDANKPGDTPQLFELPQHPTELM